MLGSGSRTAPLAFPFKHARSKLLRVLSLHRTYDHQPLRVWVVEPNLAQAMKKARPKGQAFFMVAVVSSSWNDILRELSRWKQVYRGGTGLVYSTE